jgi:transposase
MSTVDGRSLTVAALEERRRTIIRMKLNGNDAKEIAEATGCSIKTVYPLWKKYSKNEDKENIFNVKTRGNRYGNGRTLSAPQEDKIKKIIIDKYPDQLKFDFALWTREAVKNLIKKIADILMPIRTVGMYLQRWNFTPQRPIKHSYKRNDQEIKNWLNNEYPAIKKRAKREKADIYWGDETAIRTSDVRGRGYAPEGKTPIVKNTEIKITLSMISAITNQGKVLWKLHESNINADKFLDFAKRLIWHRKKKVFLLLDNARIHRSKKIKEWQKKNNKRIEIFYLPPYSPDLNPSERVNADLKYGVGSKIPKITKEELSRAVDEHMCMLQKTPSRIKLYFKDKRISYAA